MAEDPKCPCALCDMIEKSTWISIKDRLPEENEWIYLGSSNFKATTWGIRLNNLFVNPDSEYSEIIGITHWMPLPEPPNEE